MSAINPSAANPFTPPRAAVDDVPAPATEFSVPRVWAASGRIGRLRYLSYLMVGYLCAAILGGVIGGILMVAQQPMLGVTVIYACFIPYLVLSVLAAIQRAHDMDWSGWTVLLALIPLVGFVWLFKAGTPGANRFGAPPPPNTTGVKIGALLMPVSIVLVGILAAIALPAYQQYVMRAKAVQMQSLPPAQ